MSTYVALPIRCGQMSGRDRMTVGGVRHLHCGKH